MLQRAWNRQLTVSMPVVNESEPNKIIGPGEYPGSCSLSAMINRHIIIKAGEYK